MCNELLLIISLVVIYGCVLLMYRLFGRTGLFCWVAIAAILANIEVLRIVEAFGIEQTLGNVLFASSFLATDILSETEGRLAARKAVALGIASSVIFIIVSQSWLLYEPSASDWAGESFEIIFSNTPRLIIVSIAVYAICQNFDIWFYHKIWALTEKISGSSRAFLWIRNNVSTLVSQIINTLLFNFGAFWGIYDMDTLISICIGSYVVFIVTSIADTPAVYWGRKLGRKEG